MSRNYNQKTYRPYPGDENLVVSFSLEDFKNETRTREEGRAVFEDREMISITLAGASSPVIVAPASSYCTMPELEMGQGTQVRYQDRFPEDYDRWKEGQEAAVVGTHIKHAAFLSKADVSNLTACNVFTIEQLSDLGGEQLRRVGINGRKWQQMALAYLESASSTKDATSFAAEKASLLEEIAALRASLETKTEGSTGIVPVSSSVEEKEKPECVRKDEIKQEIARITGKKPLGNPSLERLESDLAELQAQQ